MLAQVQSTPVVVLDEIDTGVSGEVASFMGAAMRAIAHSDQTAQVLSVTHLPQVAAQAEHHWEVRKSTDGTTTEVDVTALDEEGKLQAIATMLSASEVTAEALGQASQLLAAAQATDPKGQNDQSRPTEGKNGNWSFLWPVMRLM